MEYTKGEWKWKKGIYGNYVIYGGEYGEVKIGEIERHFNRDLVVASPDMYQALKTCLYYLDHKEGDTLERGNVLDMIIQSLAKVEGN